MVPLSGIGLSSISRVFYVNVPLCTSSGNWCFKGLKGGATKGEGFGSLRYNAGVLSKNRGHHVNLR